MIPQYKLEIIMYSTQTKLAWAAIFTLPLTCIALPINVTAGWNLVGNGDSTSINVSSLLGDKTKVISVWKWNKTKGTWAFYAPSMDAATLASYAASKGYDILDTVLPKEGYWVNSTYTGSLSDPTATPPAVGSAFPALTESDLVMGWNLVASAGNMNPSQLNTGLRTTLGTAGKSIVTAWAWDSTSSRWRFYATSLEAQAGTAMADYIQTKGYLPYSIAPTSTDGFWLNIGTGSIPVTSPTLALDSAKAFMGTLRSNIKALGASDISLQTELQATADDLKNRKAPLATSNIDSLKTIHNAVLFWDDVVKNPNTPFTSTLSLYSSKNSYGGMPPYGSCTLYFDPNYTTVALAKDEAKYIACGTSEYYVDTISATDTNGILKSCSLPGDWCQTKWSARTRINPDLLDRNKFIVYTQTRESVFTMPAAAGLPYIETRTNYGAPFPGNTSTLLVTRDINGSIDSVNLQGELAPGYEVTTNWNSYYDATLDRWLVKPNAVATLYGDKHNVSFDGKLTHPVAGQNRYTFSGSTELIKNGLVDTHLNLLEGSYVLASSSSVASAQGTTSTVQDGSQEVMLKISGGSSTGYISGQLKFGSFSLDASHTRYEPRLFEFSGSVTRNGTEFFSGSIASENPDYGSFNESLPSSSTNYTSIHSSFAGTINIPTRSPLLVNMAINQIKAGNSSKSSIDASGQYTQGPLIINLSAYRRFNVTMMTLQSTDGVQLTIDPSKTSYPITSNGALEGVYDINSSQINYIDGTYEVY